MPNPYYNVLQARGAVATASSTLNTGNFKASNAIDGSYDLTKNSTTRWISQGGVAGEWLQVETDCILSVNKFVLYTGNSADGVTLTNAVRDAEFQVWINDNWVTVGSFTGNPDNGFKQEVKLEKFYKTSKARVLFSKDSFTGNYRVFEFEAYGRVIGKLAKGTSSKNLLKPFTSSEWNYTTPIVSIEPSKLQLNLPSSKTNELIIPAKPNTTYTLSGKTNGRVYIVQRAGNNDKAGTGYSNWNTINRTITTGSDVTGLRVSCTTDDAGIKTYEKLMLNEGAYPLPYQPYELNMKEAVLKGTKNLIPQNAPYYSNTSYLTVTKLGDYKFNLKWTNGFDFYIRGIAVERNTDYTVTLKKELIANDVSIAIRDTNNSTLVSVPITNGVTFNSGNNTEIWLRFARANGDVGEVNIYDLQLEKGTATPFKPYRGKNKPSAKVPKGNLIPPFTNAAWSLMAPPITEIVNGYEMFTSSLATNNTISIPVKPNTTYTFSVDNPNKGIYFIDSYKDTANLTRHTKPEGNTDGLITLTTHASANILRFIFRGNGTSGVNCTWKNPQLEEGGVKTPFKKQKLGAKPAVLTQPKKNLLKGLLSGAWGFSALATVINDLTFQLNATAPYLGNYQYVENIEANTDYTLSFEYSSSTGAGYVTPKIEAYNGSTLISTIYNQASGPSPASATITTPAGTNRLRVWIQNSNNTGMVFTFTKIQLEKGAKVTPFTPYTTRAKDKRI